MPSGMSIQRCWLTSCSIRFIGKTGARSSPLTGFPSGPSGGSIGVGANFFHYQQLEGDSGSGPTLGSFKGRTIGIGPVLSYITKVWQHDLAAELKWLPEIDVGNRLEGDSIWFKLAMAF